MTDDKFRILSLDSSEIVKQTAKNGAEIGYRLPAEKNRRYFRKFKNYLDWSLDSEELQRAYKSIVRRKFSFEDENGFSYTLAVVNVSFEYVQRGEKEGREAHLCI